MTDRHTPFWNIRSSEPDDEDDVTESSYQGRTGPFYGYDDDEDEDEDKAPIDRSYRSSSGASSSRPSLYDRYGLRSTDDKARDADPVLGRSRGSPRPTTPATSREGGRIPQPSFRPQSGASDRPKPEKKPGPGLGGRLGGGLSALRKRLPGGSGERPRATAGGSGMPSYGSRASQTTSLGQRDRDHSRLPGREPERKAGRSRFRISLPFRRGEGQERQPKSPPSAPRDIKRAKPLPRSARRPRIKNEGLSLDLKLDIAGWGMVVLAVIIFFGAISSNQGDLSRTLLQLIYQLVGVGWVAVPVALGGTGIWLIWRHFGDRAPEADYVHIIGWIVTYLGALGSAQFIHLLSTPVQTLDQLQAFSDQAVELGQGGGWVGGLNYMTLMRSLGDIGTFFALLGWLGIGILLATDLSIAQLVGLLRRVNKRLITGYRVRRTERAAAKRALAPAEPARGELPERQSAAPLNRPAASPLKLPEPDAIPAGQTPDDQTPFIRRRQREYAEAAEAAASRDDAAPASHSPVREVAASDLTATGRPSTMGGTGARYTPAPTSPAASGDQTAEGPIPIKPGLMRVRRPQYDEAPAEPTVATAVEDKAVPEAVPGFPKTGAPVPEDELDDETVAPSNEILFGGVRTRTPAQIRTGLTGGPEPVGVAEPAPSSPEKPDNEPPPVKEEPAAMQPATPRNPERARQIMLARQRGAGLSPAERAALFGSFARPAAEPEPDEPEAETGTDHRDELDDDLDEKALADEPVYEPLPDAEAPVDDIPVVEIDDADTLDEDETEEEEETGDDDSDQDDFEEEVFQPPIRTFSRADYSPPSPAPEPPVVEAPPVRSYSYEPAPRPVKPASPVVTPEPMAGPSLSASTEPQQWIIPDFREILDPATEQNINDDILLDRARIIEDTLASFGAPGKVVEVNPGPVITQFGVEPDYIEGRAGKRTRVKVQAIARLADDLALSLAARSIRIEAPVPGKGFVGVEVPNAEAALVSLRDIMESPEYERIDSRLRIGLGQSVDGTPVVADLTAMPHLLIAGTTGSGKSVCVNSLIACLLLQNTPETLQFIMVDPKRVELTGYNGIPHLLAPVVVDLERIVGVLKWVTREMDDRYKKFNERGARNIAHYNNILGPDEKPLPYYVVVVDELADLMMLAPDETERVLTRLAQMSRATGIHLIISTQRPSVDIITGLIKANFPARIAFAVASSVDSRVILDQPGAERLLGRGDMLFQAPDAAAPVRLQGVFVSDAELERLVSHWKGTRVVDRKAPPVTVSPFRPDTGPSVGGGRSSFGIDPIRSRTEKYGPVAGRREGMNFWDDVAPKVDRSRSSSDDVDELYDEAVAVVRRLKKASVSLLQRQLRIGYTRAARLIDVMEERGVVGPPTSGSKPRKVVGYSDEDIELDADDYDYDEDEIEDDLAEDDEA